MPCVHQAGYDFIKMNDLVDTSKVGPTLQLKLTLVWLRPGHPLRAARAARGVIFLAQRSLRIAHAQLLCIYSARTKKFQVKCETERSATFAHSPQ